MERSVPLANLPPNLQFPESQTDRIRYDGMRRSLIYRGVMRKADYDGLIRLSDDVAYLDAIQKLFCTATFAAPQPRPSKGRLVKMAGGIILLLACAGGSIWYVLAHRHFPG